MSAELERSPNLDCYGMTPEERAEFEGQYIDPPRADAFGKYVYQDVSEAAGTWADCAKLYRPSVEPSRAWRQIEKQAATIKELEAENLRAWGEYNNAQAEARNAHTEHLALIGRAVAAEKRVRELEDENDQLRVELIHKALEPLSKDARIKELEAEIERLRWL